MDKPVRLLCVIVVVCFATPLHAGEWPRFSWDSVPVFYHSCNFTGPFTDEAIQEIARFPFVTIEKGQGVETTGYAEDKIVSVLRRVKEVDPNISTVFYYNSVLDWPFYKLHEEFIQHPDWWLKDNKGKVCRLDGDGTFPNHTNMLAFDFAQEEVRNFWASECYNMTATGYVDGCFSDRATGDTCHASDDYLAGHILVHQQVQKLIGNGPLIANHAYDMPGVNGVQIEGFSASEENIELLMECVSNGKIVEAHAGYSQDGDDNHCQNITNSLAAFLIGAGSRSYYTCSKGWKIQTDPVQDAWHPEYDKPLGTPLSNGTKGADGIWRRLFQNAKGVTNVTFNPANNQGSIWWAGEPKPPPPPSPPSPAPPTLCSVPSTYNNNTGIAGNDICERTGCPKTNTAMDCCELCEKDGQCVAFTWYVPTDDSSLRSPCHLHSTWSGHWSTPNRVSGYFKKSL